MNLWLLRPVDPTAEPWDEKEHWFNKPFGYVVRAETEQEARDLATEHDTNHLAEGFIEIWTGEKLKPWLDPALALCEELLPSGAPGVILRDFRSA